MPHDLASDPTKTVFEYGAIVSPPKDWERWYDLVRDFTAHLLERYGDEVVEHWSFEVWNEANLEVFWSGSPGGVPHAVRRHRGGCARRRPAAAGRRAVVGRGRLVRGAARRHRRASGAPVDFLSTHTYGAPPLDFRPMLERHGRSGTPIWWTEWGVTPTHFNEVSDAVFAGVFLARGMLSAMGRIEALSYWVVSDHFEELGRPPALLHGGFGLRTVGELRKPRWWALAMLERLGPRRLAVAPAGDGGGSLVEAVAGGVRGRHLHGRVLEPHASTRPRRPARRRWRATCRWRSPGSGRERPTSWSTSGSTRTTPTSPGVWGRLKEDGQDWPSDEQWAQLREADRLEELEPARRCRSRTTAWCGSRPRCRCRR